ncbi:putative Oxidoreductase [Seiridium cardinale]|uniref:Oxidoreductase n=1 Tax=Seiridium cardinale TaxID=138064 RepID=A0ABR2XZ29_9PEZI
MSKPWILVSPSSRGIGHALTRHLLQNTSVPIVATCRSRDTSATKASLLDHLPSLPNHHEKEDHASRLVVFQLDVTDESSVREASERAAEIFPPKTHHLHLGLSIPGILHPEKAPSQVDYQQADETFRVNALGPLMLMKHFGELLPKKRTDLSVTSEGGDKLRLPGHATWLNMSARVGSVSDNRLGGWYSYRASKAAVNSLTRTFDLYLQNRSGNNAMAFAYHPGTVKTGLSEEFWGNVKEQKLFSPEFAVEKLCEVVSSRAPKEHRGRIWDWDGKEVLP